MGEHAIVIGASMAGLTAGRVLSEHFAAVTILDRDALPTEAAPRKGVPQGQHAHAILAAGQRGLESLLPGLIDELKAAGAVETDGARRARWFQGGAYRCQFDSDLLVTAMSRPLLEHQVRRRVAALDNVALRAHTSVNCLIDNGGRVGGVVLADGSRLDADLVVDASGRSGQTLAFLRSLGFDTPDEVRVEVGIGYTSCVFRRRPGDLPGGADYAIIANDPPAGRLGVILPLEDDRWIVTLGGYFGDHAPTDEDGFLVFARSLPTTDVADLVESAPAYGEPVSFKYAASQRRLFEKVKRVPAGYLAIGDSICSFNPIYGQGMSSATLQALELGRALERQEHRSEALPRAFYKAAGKVVDAPWQIAAGADFALPGTRGRKPSGTDAVNRYLAKVLRATHVSPEAGLAMYQVQNLLESPSALMKPGMMAKVFKAAKQSPAGRPGPIAEPLVIATPAEAPADADVAGARAA